MVILKELARNRDKVLSMLDSGINRTREHLLKLYYYRDDKEDLMSWVKEVRAYMGRVSKIKKSGYPSSALIYKEIWLDDLDSFEDEHKAYVDDFMLEMPELGEIEYDPQATEFCSDYFLWLSKKLSSQGTVSLSEVLGEVYLLREKYPV